jgi:broad-specificity NMP kinase
MKIYITGISGTGKSAIVKELKKKGVFAFDIEEIKGLCFWTDKKTGKKAKDYSPSKSWLEKHDWICDTKKLKKILKSNKKVLIATGITGNQDEYLNMFDKIFLLQSPPHILEKRMSARHKKPGENNFGQYKDERNFALSQLKKFNTKMINKGAIPINSNTNISKVADKIMTEIKI